MAFLLPDSFEHSSTCSCEVHVYTNFINYILYETSSNTFDTAGPFEWLFFSYRRTAAARAWIIFPPKMKQDGFSDYLEESETRSQSRQESQYVGHGLAGKANWAPSVQDGSIQSKPFYLHKLFRVFFDNDMGDDVTQNDDFQRQTTALEGLRKSEPFFKAWSANGPPLLIHLPPLFPIHLDAAFYASFTAPDGLPRIFVALRGSRGRRTEIFT